MGASLIYSNKSKVGHICDDFWRFWLDLDLGIGKLNIIKQKCTKFCCNFNGDYFDSNSLIIELDKFTNKLKDMMIISGSDTV